MNHDRRPRGAQSGERCTCAHQAVVAYLAERFGQVGSCGRGDGGRRGRCLLGGEPAGHFGSEERGRLYALRHDALLPIPVIDGAGRPHPEPGPEAA